jgi:hypothetical protein
LAGALLFVEKIRQRADPFLLGLGEVEIFYSQVIIQRTVVVFSAFLEHGSAEKIAVCAHSNRDPNKHGYWLDSFLSEAAQNLEVFCQKFITKIKKSKQLMAI